jgi:5-methylcytosine-specific restriction endonuclease McrA
MASRAERNNRPGRESLKKRLGVRVCRAIDKRDGCRCFYCGDTAKPGAPLQLDHLVCKSHGGADVATNLVTACRRCNRARSNMTLRQWAAYAASKLGLKVSPAAVVKHARKIDLAV